MTVELETALPVTLRSVGLDERWLQDRISNDPALLGLGDLEIAGREHRQPVGGRIDFLMRDAEQETYYEIEVMLGALDESHIIRTIEYWDIERQRRPQWDHVAVIVAEKITSRFFNVLRLLNRAVPLIAVQLSAFRVGDKIVLNPVTVLNVVEEVSDPGAVDVVERVDRAYWEQKMSPTALAVADRTVTILKGLNLEPRVTYNRGHIALGTTGYNFCWFNPRKADHCRIDLRVEPESRDTILSLLQQADIDPSQRGTNLVLYNISPAAFDGKAAVMKTVLETAEKESR
jgi:hypothetical protein